MKSWLMGGGGFRSARLDVAVFLHMPDTRSCYCGCVVHSDDNSPF